MPLPSINFIPTSSTPSSSAQEPQARDEVIRAVYGKFLPNNWQQENSLGTSIQIGNSIVFGGPALGMRPDLSYHISGCILGINAFGNLINIPANARQIAHAKRIGDRRAVRLGGLSLAANVLSAGSAVSIGGGFRIASIISLVKGGAASSLLGRVSVGFLFSGIALFSIWNVVLLAITGVQIYEGCKWKNRVTYKDQTTIQKIELLEKKLLMEPEEYIQKLKNAGRYKDILEKEAMEKGIPKLRCLIKELGLVVTEQELSQLMESILDKEGEFQINGETLTFMQRIGFELKLEALNEKKIEKFMRVIGNNKELVKKIRSGEATEATIEAVKKEIKRTIVVNALAALVFVMGIGGMVLGAVCTAGAAVIVGAVLMGICSLALLLLDAYSFNRALKNNQETLFNKKQLAISTTAIIISFWTIVSLQIAGVLTLGIIPLMIVAAVTLFFILYNAYAWRVLSKHQSTIEKTEEKPESLEECKEYLLAELDIVRELTPSLEFKKMA